MTPQEAIDKLDRAAAVVSSNREGHAVLQEAVQIIRAVISDSKKQ